jgi:hypothetical protein
MGGTAWLWQGLIAHIIDICVFAAAGAVVVFLKVKRPHWAALALYGLGAVALVAIIWYSLSALRDASLNASLKTTPENVEAHIRNWCDTFRVSVGTNSSSPVIKGISG